MITYPCLNCGTAVELTVEAQHLAASFGVVCEDCITRDHKLKRNGHITREKVLAYAKLCPPCFEDTIRDKLPCPEKSALALNWKYEARGLNLWGWPATGKTRTMGLVLHRQVLEGRKVIALSSGGFRAECEARAYHRGPWLKLLISVDLLFLDDLDKCNLTTEMEKDLFHVLNCRMGRKPTCFTGNTQGDRLELQFRLGVPLVRRIRQHCQSIHFTKPG